MLVPIAPMCAALALLVAAGCGGKDAGPAQAPEPAVVESPVIAQPAPVPVLLPQSPPAGPLTVTPAPCAPLAPLLYTEQRVLTGVSSGVRKLEISTSGYWSARVIGGLRAVFSGCIEAGELARLTELLARADFSPQAPLRSCDTPSPTRKIYTDAVRGRSVTAYYPCAGPRASLSLQALSARMGQASVEPARPPAPCKAAGAPIYHHRTAPLHINGRLLAPKELRALLTTYIAVWSTGLVRRDSGWRIEEGCLDTPKIRALQQKIRGAVMTLTPSASSCRALPGFHNELLTSKARLRWAGPCGATQPDWTTDGLLAHVDKLTAAN